MNPTEYADFAAMRAELTRDYAPATAQERLLVMEVAAAWRRLDHCRRREDLFFDLQRQAESHKTGVPKEELGEGSEVMMWLDKPQRAYDQVLASIREAHVMFGRTVRRIEDVQHRRRTRERQERKQAATAESSRNKVSRSAPATHAPSAAPATGGVVEMPVQPSGGHRILKT